MRGGVRAVPAATVDRLDFIEGMRGVAALYVVLSHFVTMADPGFHLGTSKAPEWLQMLMAPFAYGHLAVAAFITISGYCLQMSLLQGKDGRMHDKGRFFRRRALRILPPYYACLAISIAVCLLVTQHQPGMPFTQYVPVTWENVLAHVFLVHNFNPDWMYKLNGVLWSIAIEVQLYVLFPVLVALLFRVGRVGLVVLTSAVAVGCLLAFPESMKLYPWYLALFCVGMAAAHYAYRPHPKAGPRPHLAAAAGALAVATLVIGKTQDWEMPALDALAAFAAVTLMYIGTVTPWNRVARLFSTRPLLGLGLMSYSLYLMHHPVQQVVYVYRPPAVQGEAAGLLYLLAVGLPIILLTTWLFSLAFERPFMPKRLREIEESSRSPVTTEVALVQNRLAVGQPVDVSVRAVLPAEAPASDEDESAPVSVL